MLLEKYSYAYRIIAVIIFVNIAVSTLSLIFFIPNFVFIPVCFISSFIGVMLVSAVIPNTELVPKDEKAKFTKNTLLYSIVLGCMNIGASFGVTFLTVAIFGGFLFRIGNLYISTSIVSLIGFVIYLAVQWRFLTYSGYQATIRKEYNGPLFAITGALAISFHIPVMMEDWVVKKPLETPLTAYDAHVFLSALPFLRPAYAAAIGILIMVALNIIMIYAFYKKGREAFFEEHPHNRDYDGEEQKEIYKNEKTRIS